MNISIEGVDALRNALQKYTADAEKKIHKGLVKGVRIVQGEARAEAPFDTGTLRRSIHGQIDGTTGVVGTNTEYAIYQEFGTYKMKARPFLAPALKSKQGEVISAIAEQFKR